jgi:hypothetical protein
VALVAKERAENSKAAKRDYVVTIDDLAASSRDGVHKYGSFLD